MDALSTPLSVSASASVSPGSSASVRPVACLRCNYHHASCSKEKPRCARCRARGYECLYKEGRKVTVNESHLRLLEEKARAYDELSEAFGRNQTAGRDISAPRRRQAPEVEENHVNEDELEDDRSLLEPFNRLGVGRDSTSFKGPGAADNFLRSLRNLSGLEDDDGSLDANPSFYDPGALPSRREYAWVQPRLPPVDICRHLFAAQYTYIGTIFAFTSPASFDVLLREARRGPPDVADKDACLSHAKVLIILAFGQLYSVNQWIDFRGPPGFEYFTHALQLLPDAHEQGSITCVETLALIGYFMQNMNRRDAAFLYIGMALRMAISLGLHQEVGPAGGELDEPAREHRRRVWWSVYSLDRILSVKSGNPVTIQDEDIGARLPSKLPSEPDYCPAVVLRHYTELSRIHGEVSRTIYRRLPEPRPGRRVMAAVQAILLSLSTWDAELPEQLRFEPSRLSISRESVSTFSHYYQCINMTARPLLFRVVRRRLADIRADPASKERDWRDGLSQTTVRVIDMCVSAAQATINMMAVAAQRDLVATYGYMDGEHVFSAAIVLVVACAAFPTATASTAAMDAGLGLLRGMAERGNSAMGARYALLAHLRGVVAAGPTPPPPPPPPPPPSVFQPDDESAFLQLPPEGASGGGVSALGMLDAGALRDAFYDGGAPGSSVDFGLWEEGFADPTADAGFDITRWTGGFMGGDEEGCGGDGGMEG